MASRPVAFATSAHLTGVLGYRSWNNARSCSGVHGVPFPVPLAPPLALGRTFLALVAAVVFPALADDVAFAYFLPLSEGLISSSDSGSKSASPSESSTALAGGEYGASSAGSMFTSSSSSLSSVSTGLEGEGELSL